MFDRNKQTRRCIAEKLAANTTIEQIAFKTGVRRRRIEQVRNRLDTKRRQVAGLLGAHAEDAMSVQQLLDFKPKLEALRLHAEEIKRQSKAGKSASDILHWLNHEGGLKVSRSYFYPQYMLIVGGGRSIHSPSWKKMLRRQKIEQVSDWHPRAYTDTTSTEYTVNHSTLNKARMVCMAAKMAFRLMRYHGELVSRAEAQRLDREQRCIDDLVVQRPQTKASLSELAISAGVKRLGYSKKTRHAMYGQAQAFFRKARGDQRKCTGVPAIQRARECARNVANVLKRRVEFNDFNQDRFANYLVDSVNKGRGEDDRAAACVVVARHLGWSVSQVSREMSGRATAMRGLLKGKPRKIVKRKLRSA